MSKYIKSNSTILNSKKNIQYDIKSNSIIDNNFDDDTKKQYDQAYDEIKKNIIKLEKTFLDNVLLQVKKKNIAGNKNTVEKSAINELNKYKKNIELLKSKVSVEDNTDKIVKLENKIKENEEILQKLINDKEGLENISKQQLKAIDEICLNETQISIQTKYEEIRKLKEDLMKWKFTYNENENLLKKKQEQLIHIDNQLKKNIFNIKNSKNNNMSSGNSNKNLSNIHIQTLKTQIDMINDNIANDTQMYDEKIKQIQNNINSAQNDIEFLNSQIEEIKRNIENISLDIKKMRKQKKEK
ncbi:conserved Plasmodium protein, unknown function [Plasmodium sp. DRC-Itaito]|nr:conserved Plasmodium protein, unknown function [Plasmodium sp. DRC-Itaito]